MAIGGLVTVLKKFGGLFGFAEDLMQMLGPMRYAKQRKERETQTEGTTDTASASSEDAGPDVAEKKVKALGIGRNDEENLLSIIMALEEPDRIPFLEFLRLLRNADLYECETFCIHFAGEYSRHEDQSIEKAILVADIFRNSDFERTREFCRTARITVSSVTETQKAVAKKAALFFFGDIPQVKAFIDDPSDANKIALKEHIRAQTKKKKEAREKRPIHKSRTILPRFRKPQRKPSS